MTVSKTAHATFVIGRSFASPPAQVFAAWTERKGNARWFKGPAEWKERSTTPRQHCSARRPRRSPTSGHG